jgi:hypothetical protein
MQTFFGSNMILLYYLSDLLSNNTIIRWNPKSILLLLVLLVNIVVIQMN